MSDLGWRADGIQRALAAGGIELETYRQPGFTGGLAGRRVPGDTNVSGFDSWAPEGNEAAEIDPTPQLFRRNHR